MRPNAYLMLAIFAFASSAFGISPTSYSVFEELVTVPEGWRELPSVRVNPETPLAMRIHLAQQNVVAFEQKVMDISTPGHPTYGDHMGTADIKRMLQPSQDTLASVLTWLEGVGISEHVAVEHDWIKLNVTIAQAENLLKTKYSYFRDDEEKNIVLRTLSYSLPVELHAHILLVQPTTMFGMKPMRNSVHSIVKTSLSLLSSTQKSPVGLNVTACNTTITPACLKSLYNFQNYTVRAKGRNRLGINGFLEQYAQYDDLEIFLKTYAKSAVGGNFSVALVNGGINSQNPGNDTDAFAEANLDVQYAVSLSYPTDNIYFSTAGRPPFIPDLDSVTNGSVTNDNEPYLDWLNWIVQQNDIPQTITTSYGDSEQTVPLSYRKSVCNLFAQLGARGVSVIFSSGDFGPGSSCRSNDGKNTTKFLPVFPAACPWVTSVGGTEFVEPEQAVYFSGGGFSETWPAPSYQREALDAYFGQNPNAWQPWSPYFNKTGRGFPDVAMQALNYMVVLGNNSYKIGGTSASTPAFGALVSLLNDDRIASGKKPLGFLNPWLYSGCVASTFNDITLGRSTGCTGNASGVPIPGNPGIVPGAGWDAVPGWDPVTGLGTPNFEEMRML